MKNLTMHFIPSFLKIQKEKIPQGYGFSLKTFEWVEAFQSSGITTEMVLRYSRENVYIQVSFWIPNDWRNYEWFYIKIGMVPSKLLPSARETMRIKVIPELIQWMNKLLSFSFEFTRTKEQPVHSMGFSRYHRKKYYYFLENGVRVGNLYPRLVQNRDS